MKLGALFETVAGLHRKQTCSGVPGLPCMPSPLHGAMPHPAAQPLQRRWNRLTVIPLCSCVVLNNLPCVLPSWRIPQPSHPLHLCCNCCAAASCSTTCRRTAPCARGWRLEASCSRVRTSASSASARGGLVQWACWWISPVCVCVWRVCRPACALGMAGSWGRGLVQNSTFTGPGCRGECLVML